MKNIIFSLILFSVVAFSNAQIVTIPDANFKAKLLQAAPNLNIATDSYGDFVAIDINGNGEIEVTEAENIFELRIGLNNIGDLTGIEAFINIEVLFCTGNPLTDLDLSQNINLIQLVLNNNDLTTLDLSQNINLESLYCYGNELNNVNLTQNINLRELVCYWNNLTNLDLSQNINLEELVCHSNQLSSLDLSMNSNLQILNCSVNSFTNLDVSQNQQLTNISSADGQLIELILGQQPNLEFLSFQNNQVTSIDLTQAPNLRNLNAHTNNLSEIDISQNIDLDYIWISENQINSLDLSNNSELITLFCENNLLTELDMSNTKVDEWNVSNNQITYINIKNGQDSGAGAFNNNPVEFICTDSDEIELYEALSSFQIPVSDYCSIAPGGDYNTVAGSLILDTNNDGCDGNDTTYPGLRIDISDGTDSGMTFSNNSGEYTFYTGTGNFVFMPNFENPSWFNVSPSTITIPFSDVNNTVTQDFCITPNGTHNDLEIVISPSIPAQPGFDATYQIVYKNKGNQVLSGAIDLSYDDSVLDFVSSTLVADAQSAGSLTWNYTDLNPFESRTIQFVLNVNSPMETPPVNNDDVLAFTVTASPLSGDETPTDNTFELNQIVVGSYDPNDITCLEGDVVSPERIGEYLHYNIRFENTGTAPATFIVVKDLIDDTKYDLSTLQILSASHDMVTRVEGNQVEFFFEAINLAPLEQGNVLFKIKSLNTLVTGDSVSQQAEIYFDYNFPIITNIALTTFENLSVENPETNNLVSIYPNPTSGLLTINSRSSIKSLELFDIQGRRVRSFSISEANTIDISNVSKGVYFLDINTNAGKAVKKIIKD